jgi:endonuclease/exonuclease/phosphatase family metal-dependent hydrolase
VSFGDSIHIKNPEHLRIFFQNVKGLSQTATSDDFRYYSHSIRDLQVDICCLAETNTPWQLPHHRQDFLHAAKSTLGNIKVEFASPSQLVDPIIETARFQAGGNLLMACGKWVPSIFGPPIRDPTGLGRWCGITIRGKHGNLLTIITAYRVCNGHIHTAPLGSSFAREYVFLKQSGDSRPNPRKTFVDDLATEIRTLLDAQHHVILALDANTIVETDAYFRQMIDFCDLNDIHKHTCAPSTYIGAENRRIDYIFGSPHVMDAVTRSGTLSYVEGPQADHRPLYLDLDAFAILQYNPTDQEIPSSQQRNLKTGNPELVANYVASMQVYYINHSMEERINRLYDNKEQLSREMIRMELRKVGQRSREGYETS